MKKDRQGSVYVLHCLINDKEYVGQTIKQPAELRWREHIACAFSKKDERPLYRAMRKHGLKAFTAEVIWRGSELKLDSVEKFHIRKRKTFINDGWGYNLTTGGHQYRLSAYSRRKLARLARRQWADETVRARHANTPERSKRMSEVAKERSALGAYHSVVARRKMARKTTRAWLHPEYVAAHKTASLKRWATESAHAKMCVVAKTRCTPEWRAAVAERSRAKWADPAYKEMMRAKLKARWADKGVRLRRVQIAASAEVKAKLSKAGKTRWAVHGAKESQAARLKARYEDPVLRAKISRAVKMVWDDSARRDHMLRGNIARWSKLGARKEASVTQRARRTRERAERTAHGLVISAA